VKRILIEQYMNLARMEYDLRRSFSQKVQNSASFPADKVSGSKPELPAIHQEDFNELSAKWINEPPPGLARQLEQLNDMNYDEVSRTAVDAFHRNCELRVTTYADFRATWRLRNEQAGGEDKTMLTAALILKNLFPSIARIRLTRTSLLLRAWMLEHDGKPPDSLDALVPDYLPELPVDPYDGKPLRYDKEKVWSVGEDLKDDGGKFRGDMVQVL